MLPIVNELFDSFSIVLVTPSVVKDALRIKARYGFSIWYSYIVAAALYATVVSFIQKIYKMGK